MMVGSTTRGAFVALLVYTTSLGKCSAFRPRFPPGMQPKEFFRLLAKERDNKAMQFLKKIGRAGHRRDFTHAIGVDEGTSGKSSGGGAHVGSNCELVRYVVRDKPTNFACSICVDAAEKICRFLFILC